jgi:integrase
MISIYKRGSRWWLRGSINGATVPRRSLDTRHKATAERRARQFEEQLERGQVSITWQQFLGEFTPWAALNVKPATQEKYRFTLARFGQFLERAGILGLVAITPATISDYLADRRGDLHPTKQTPVGPEGIKSDLRVLHACFAWAIDRGYLQANPVRFPRLNARARDTQPFSQEEISRMLADTGRNARPDLRAILLTFLTTGLRISDVCGLEKASIDFTAGVIIHRTQKRGKVVALPLHPELREELEKSRSLTPAQEASPLLFSTMEGKPLRNLDGILRALWRRCGVQGGHAHKFRDAFAVRLLERGASLYDVAKLLGITVQVCERHYAPYTKELQERGRRLVDQISFGNGTDPSQSPVRVS